MQIKMRLSRQCHGCDFLKSFKIVNEFENGLGIISYFSWMINF